MREEEHEEALKDKNIMEFDGINSVVEYSQPAGFRRNKLIVYYPGFIGIYRRTMS